MYADCRCFTLEGGDWSYTDLREVDLSHQTMENVNFYGADLTGCRIEKSTLRDCNFTEARLSNARFCESDLRGSKLEGIDVLGIEWKNAKIDLAQAVLLAEALGAKYLP